MSDRQQHQQNDNTDPINVRPVIQRLDTVISEDGEGYDVLPPAFETETETEIPVFPGYKPRIPYMSAYSSPSRLMVGMGSNFLAKTPVTLKVTNAEKRLSYRNPFNPYIYTVEVEHGPFHWVIYKRYHHFLELHEKLWAYRASLKIPLPTKRHIQRRKTKKAIRRKANDFESKIPRFPKRPDIWVSPELIEKRQEQLELYLNTMLKSPMYRNNAATKKFLEVSQFSFIEDLGRKGKEGVIRKRSGGHRIRVACLERVFNVRSANLLTTWSSRWFVIKDTCLMYLDPHLSKVKGVFLFDSTLSVEHLKKRSQLLITNSSRRLLVNCWTERQASVWKSAIEKTIQYVCPDITDKNQRYRSFAPVRSEFAHWFVDGREYMSAVADAIENATEEIFITDWWLSPEIYLKRPLTPGEHWRLDKVLKRKADEGVKIYVLLYKEVELAVSLDSAYTKRTLQELNPNNIRVLRHPDHIAADTLLWAHHEKIVVVDQVIAFIGGIDLCYGRWDDHRHLLTDIGSGGLDELDCTEKNQQTVNGRSALSNAMTMLQTFPLAVLDQVASQEETDTSVTNGNSKNHEEPDENETRVQEETSITEYDRTNGKENISSNGPDKIEPKPKTTCFNDMKQPSEDRPIAETFKDNLEVVRQHGISKMWFGKDYNNFVLKDLTKLDEPYDDVIDRNKDPRMPWHDIASVTYGKAARDTARHFIQRWNFTKIQKAKNYKNVPFLLPKSYDKETMKLRRDRIHPDAVQANVQILRSSSEWSAGITETEHSIQNAYLKAIKSAEHYIYIENQFFISVRNHPQIHNKIVDALYNRILKASEEKKTFRVFVIMPLIPGFEGDISDSSKSQAIQAVLDWQYKSIIRGNGSLIGDLQKKIGGKWTEYISFCGVRTHSELGGKPISEIIYVHSKMLIVDDRLAIIGSANINDRSMTGVRDSEVAILVEDTEMIPSIMDGIEYEVGKFASGLRKRCFAEHLGKLPENYSEESEFTPTIEMDDVVCDAFFKDIWVFCCIPCDYVKDFSQIESFQSKKMTDPELMREELKKVQGNLVLLPLQFLHDANLTPNANTKEGIAPTELWT